MSLRTVLGSFALIRRRAREVGQPGLTVYADAGAQAAVTVSRGVSGLAHQNEVTELDWAGRIARIMADKKVDRAELAELAQAPAALTRCAGRSHDIGEAVQ